MSDLYSVIRQSILDRNLRSASARQEIYAQARTAVIRQLWTYDPPLSEAEIEGRIGQFDDAVVSIEDDLVRVFAAAPPAARGSPRQRAGRAVPVFEGYDEEADYAPPSSGKPEPELEPARRPELPPGVTERRASPAGAGSVIEEIEQAMAARSSAIESALRAGRRTPAVRVEPADENPDAREPYRDDRIEERSRPEEPEPAYYEPSEVAGEQAEPYPDDGYAEDEPYPEERPYEEEQPPRRPAWASTRRQPEGPEASRLPWKSWRDWSERTRIVALLSAIGALALVLIILAIALFTSSRPTTAPAQPTSAVTNGPAVAGNTPVQSAVESFVVFDGRDPTVFQATSGNPIRFEGDTAGGFARVSSSAADAGVRVTIGPGLANRLAGRSIRLTLVARSARENGAVGLRFAYQSGVAFSHWQTANLSPDYATLGLTWRVPTQRTDATGDHILIEPGIPGDGTGADIKSIKIELLG